MNRAEELGRNPDYMRIYLPRNVYDEALDRIRWIFDEFPNVVVTVSGGKDSTVCFNLAMQVAREKGRLPLKVLWFDQEAEWQATVDEIKKMMYHPDVEPWWFQIPIRLFNATSVSEHWLKCWDPEREADWVHPHDPISIKENLLGTDRFAKLFNAAQAHYWTGTKTAFIGGVRCEESRLRFMGMVNTPTYKWATWGNGEGRGRDHYSLYPIYDWSYSDVWKAIHSNGWHYNAIYDQMYRYGIPILRMRVSNVHHETAVGALFYMQELEPETYERLVHRIEGIDMAAKMGDDYFVTDLPFMFKDWREYRDYLLKHLIDNPEWKERFKAMFDYHDRTLGDELGDAPMRAHVRAILVNDWEGVELAHFTAGLPVHMIQKAHRVDKEKALTLQREAGKIEV